MSRVVYYYGWEDSSLKVMTDVRVFVILKTLGFGCVNFLKITFR